MFRASFAFASLMAAAAFVPAHAEFHPTKPVEIIVHTGPGGGSDVLARAIAVMMEKEKLVPVRMQVINKPGGNGAVAAAAISEKPDPHTIGLITSVWIANALTTSEAKITIHDLKPVARLMTEPAVIVVRADSRFKTLREFVDAAHASPGQLKQSGGSVTSRDNIVRQLLQQAGNAKWAYVSFPGGGERLAALLGGHVDMMVIEPQEAGEQVRAGKLRVLAQVADHRLPGYPDAPTLKEAGFDVSPTPQIRAVMVSQQMPADATAYWEDRFMKLCQTATWKKYVADNQLEASCAPGPQLKQSIADIDKQMRELFTQSGIKMVR